MPTSTHFLIDGEQNHPTFLFAHGAGGAMDTPWMNQFTRGLAERGVRVMRFEFPYMAARRSGGKRGAPDRPPVLLQSWRDAVNAVGDPSTLFIGGKSMGGRIASMVADELGVRGLICLGYPFHPPGDPSRLRTEHLVSLATPALIIQGERDPFGTVEEVAHYKLSPSIRLAWIEGGDHSFKTRRGERVTSDANIRKALDVTARFVTESD